MFKNKKILAIIAARSGSKSIKDKNLCIINRHSLLYWIIKKAKKSKYLDQIFVSTDSKKYQKLALTYGANCPVLRPKKISGNNSLEIEYIMHTLKYLDKYENFKPDYIVRLQPTSPFQFTSDIDNSIKKIINDESATSLQVVSESSQPPLKALKIFKKKFLKPYFSKSSSKIKNRQKLEKSYYRSNIIVSKTKALLKNNCHIGSKSLIYEIPISRSIDINNNYDYEISKILNKKYKYL